MSQTEIEIETETQEYIPKTEYVMTANHNWVMVDVFKIENNKVKRIMSNKPCVELDFGPCIPIHSIPRLRFVKDENDILEFIALRNKLKISITPENQNLKFLRNFEIDARRELNEECTRADTFEAIKDRFDYFNRVNILKCELLKPIKESESMKDYVTVYPQSRNQAQNKTENHYFEHGFRVYGWVEA